MSAARHHPRALLDNDAVACHPGLLHRETIRSSARQECCHCQLLADGASSLAAR